MASSRKKVDPLLPEEAPTEAPKETPEPLPAVEDAPPAPKGVDEGTYGEMVAILSPQKGKRAVPTLIGFNSARANARRYVIVDISDTLVDEAYRCWKSHGYTDDEDFLDVMYKITHSDLPRMYRTVAFYDLK